MAARSQTPDLSATKERDLLELVNRYNRSGDETTIAPGDYLEAVATSR
jgi:hypothetical protein